MLDQIQWSQLQQATFTQRNLDQQRAAMPKVSLLAMDDCDTEDVVTQIGFIAAINKLKNRLLGS